MNTPVPDERAHFNSFVAVGALLTTPTDVPMTDAEIAGAGEGAAAAAIDYLRSHLSEDAAWRVIEALPFRLPRRPQLVHDRERP